RAEIREPSVVRARAGELQLGGRLVVPLAVVVARQADEGRRVRRLVVGEHDVGAHAILVEGFEAATRIPLPLDAPGTLLALEQPLPLVLLRPGLRELLFLGPGRQPERDVAGEPLLEIIPISRVDVFAVLLYRRSDVAVRRDDQQGLGSGGIGHRCASSSMAALYTNSSEDSIASRPDGIGPMTAFTA